MDLDEEYVNYNDEDSQYQHHDITTDNEDYRKSQVNCPIETTYQHHNPTRHASSKARVPSLYDENLYSLPKGAIE